MSSANYRNLTGFSRFRIIVTQKRFRKKTRRVHDSHGVRERQVSHVFAWGGGQPLCPPVRAKRKRVIFGGEKGSAAGSLQFKHARQSSRGRGEVESTCFLSFCRVACLWRKKRNVYFVNKENNEVLFWQQAVERQWRRGEQSSLSSCASRLDAFSRERNAFLGRGMQQTSHRGATREKSWSTYVVEGAPGLWSQRRRQKNFDGWVGAWNSGSTDILSETSEFCQCYNGFYFPNGPNRSGAGAKI